MNSLCRSVLSSSSRQKKNGKILVYLQRFVQSKALGVADKATEGKTALKWEICAAVCLTRLPIVTPQLTNLEEQYIQLLENQEYERSVLSDWEVEKRRQNEMIKSIEIGERSAEEMDIKITHQDLEEDFEKKSKIFTSAGMETEYDANMESLKRLVQHPLTYIVNKKLGNDDVWMLPTVAIREGENMRECAERALLTHCQNQFYGKILTNAPCGYYKYKFPKEVRLKSTDDCVGAKVFFYFAFLNQNPTPESGVPPQVEYNETESDILSYAWATQEELSRYLKPKYLNALKKILP